MKKICIDSDFSVGIFYVLDLVTTIMIIHATTIKIMAVKFMVIKIMITKSIVIKVVATKNCWYLHDI